LIEENDEQTEDESDYALNFTTSSAISRISTKILILYIPIFWLSGIPVFIYLYEWTKNKETWIEWISPIVFLPAALFCMFFIFVFCCVIFSKLFLILINLIHKPKEGIFRAEKGNKDFEYWCLRNELKKLGVWLLRNCPMPWLDIIALRWFGLRIDSSSHLNDAWCDVEFVNFGRKVMVGQGAVVMSSMVVGKYLIIKKVIFEDYVVVGGQSVISPGTIIGRDSITGALGMSNYGQLLESGWVYFGMPLIKLKPNKYAETREETIRKVDVDKQAAFQIKHKINIDEEKED